MRMDRNKVRVRRMEELPEAEGGEGTIAERIAMVWDITRDVWAMTGEHDVESRLQRDVVHLRRP